MQHHQQCLPKHNDYDKLFQGLHIYCACRSALAVIRRPPDYSQMKEKKPGKCDVNVRNTVWLDLRISQNNLLLAGTDLVGLSLMAGCREIYLFIHLLLNELLLKPATYIGTVCLLCMIKCLSLCMPLIHSLSMHWSFPFWLAVFVSAHFGFTCPNFLSGCTLPLKRRQQKKSLLIINTTENSTLFCSYWLKEPSSQG